MYAEHTAREKWFNEIIMQLEFCVPIKWRQTAK